MPANPNALEDAVQGELITAKEMEAVKEWVRSTELTKEDKEFIEARSLPTGDEIALIIDAYKLAVTKPEEVDLDLEDMRKQLEGKPISQEALSDELDYVCDMIEEVDLNETALAMAWNVVREVLRCSGDDIPVDIQECIGAVLNQRNLERLADIQRLAQEVIGSVGESDEEETPQEWTEEDTQEIRDSVLSQLQAK